MIKKAVVDQTTIHTLSYEVMSKQFCISETVATFSTYREAIPTFEKAFDQCKHASIDLVVRDGACTPLFRTSVLELHSSDSNQMYSDPYGHFGPSVYNRAYLDSPNGGYEFYTQMPGPCNGDFLED